MTEYVSPARVQEILKLHTPHDFEVKPFDGMSPEQPSREVRQTALENWETAWDAFAQCVLHEAFVQAWRDRDAFEVMRLIGAAMTDGLRDDINQRYTEIDREFD